MKKCLKVIILIICFCCFCFFLYKICSYLIEENANKKLNNDLIDIAITVQNQDSVDEENTVESEIPITVDFDKLKEQNKDIVAWIYSENTPINYPIVQTDNNSEYLYKMIDGSYNKAGTLFIDYRNNCDFSDNITIIYGHNMKNDLMFGTLTKYKDQSYYETHKKIYLVTPNNSFKIELLIGSVVSADSNIYNFSDTTDFLNMNSTFKSAVNVQENDNFIILSTCSYDYDDARYILVGVLRNI